MLQLLRTEPKLAPLTCLFWVQGEDRAGCLSVLIAIFQVSAHFFSSFDAICTLVSTSAMLLSVAQTGQVISEE